MATSSTQISQLILDQLAGGERRVLSLVVAIGKVLNKSVGVKGDLTSIVNSALRTLLATRAIVEEDGLYSLATAAAKP